MLRTLNVGNSADARGSSTASATGHGKKGNEYNHETDIIFALPKLQLDFKTEHMQGSDEPDPEGLCF